MATTDRRTGAYADWAIGTPLVTVTAPTIAEVNALTRIECGLVDGIATPRSSGSVSLSGSCEDEDFFMPSKISNGPYTGEAFYEEDGTNTYWAAFADTGDRSAIQHLIVCPAGFTGTDGIADTGDVVHIYPVRVMSRELIVGSEDDAQRFSFSLAAAGAPAFNVAVVSGS